jgi:N utilization substance protein A
MMRMRVPSWNMTAKLWSDLEMAQQGVSANRLELLQIADAVAREKSIDRMLVINAMEDAIQKAAKSRYGSENEIRAEIDPKTGEIRLQRLLEVVETVAHDAIEISLKDAKKRNPEATIGDFIAEPLPPLDFGRVAAQNAKQVIVQKVREAERERQFEEYKDRLGDIANGVVKRVEYGNVIVDLGRAEAVVRRDETLPRETYRYGDRIRAFIYDVRREQRGPQIFLSRTRPEFMAKLFAQEVPEIYDGVVEIKSVARDPGSRAKIAVVSKDTSIDPVGACVGMRGSRVQAVVNELQGEKIDIIQWSPDAATSIVNALAPAEVTKVVLDEDAERIEVVVPDDQLSLAIGRRGQNVRLASQLTGWDIDILTEAEESERRQKEFNERSNNFMESLDVDEVIAQLLASEGFASVEEIAYVEPHEIASIEGFDEDTAVEIQNRALEFLERRETELDNKRRELGVEDDLTSVEGLSKAMLVALGENGVKTLEDLADCATDDLVGWTEKKDGATTRYEGFLQPFDLTREEAEQLILNARIQAGWIEPDPEAEPEAEEAGEDADEEGEAELGGEQPAR